MRSNPFARRRAAFTLVEVSVSSALFAVAGTVMFTLLWSGSILLAKNAAINMAHQEARTAVMRMETEIHGCVSVPALVDTTRAQISGTGPAAGIAYETWASGPYQVAYGDYKATQSTIDLIIPDTSANAGPAPVAGQRLNISTHNIETVITSVTTSAGKYHVTLSSNLANEVNTAIGAQTNLNIAGFVTDQISYVVQSGQLRRYGNRNSTSYIVLVDDVTSVLPFSIPVAPSGSLYNRFVAAVNLSCADTISTSRNFKAANMYLNSMVPYRSRLLLTQ